jgi:hypothetical protein
VHNYTKKSSTQKNSNEQHAIHDTKTKQRHDTSSHGSNTKIYHKANMLTREDTMELDKNDIDEQHHIATQAQ